MANQTDYTMHIGLKYGTLTITAIVRKPKKVLAECLCDCGNATKATVLSRLISGKITSCKKCSNKLNGDKGRSSRTLSSKYNKLIGTQVNYFTVLRRAEEGEPSGTFQCRCICGNLRFLDASELTEASDRKSCGCQQARLISLAGGGTGTPYENETINCFIRKSTPEYKSWVNSCLHVNKYTCFISGQVGGNLNVHHIIPLAKLLTLYNINKENYKSYSSHLFSISNGIVLTEAIHRQVHIKYGDTVSIDNLLEFKNDYLKSQISE